MKTIEINPKLDLVLERVIDVPRDLVWAAWTTPEHIKKWFTPAPWKTVDCEIDLRPGGRFYTVMESPEGQQYPNTGCILEVIPQERLTWTDALLPDFRPSDKSILSEVMFLTAIISMESQGTGTKYTATCLHRDEAGRKKHEEMGFYHGWNAALDQLVALAKTMR